MQEKIGHKGSWIRSNQDAYNLLLENLIDLEQRTFHLLFFALMRLFIKFSKRIGPWNLISSVFGDRDCVILNSVVNVVLVLFLLIKSLIS